MPRRSRTAPRARAGSWWSSPPAGAGDSRRRSQIQSSRSVSRHHRNRQSSICNRQCVTSLPSDLAGVYAVPPLARQAGRAPCDRPAGQRRHARPHRRRRDHPVVVRRQRLSLPRVARRLRRAAGVDGQRTRFVVDDPEPWAVVWPRDRSGGAAARVSVSVRDAAAVCGPARRRGAGGGRARDRAARGDPARAVPQGPRQLGPRSRARAGCRRAAGPRRRRDGHQVRRGPCRSGRRPVPRRLARARGPQASSSAASGSGPRSCTSSSGACPVSRPDRDVSRRP